MRSMARRGSELDACTRRVVLLRGFSGLIVPHTCPCRAEREPLPATPSVTCWVQSPSTTVPTVFPEAASSATVKHARASMRPEAPCLTKNH